jgi:hypothetical protein
LNDLERDFHCFLSVPVLKVAKATKRLARRAGISVLFLGSGALAEPINTPPGVMALAPFRFTRRPLSLNAVVGVGSPVGGFGGVVEYSVASRFALGVGAGAGWYDGGYVRFPGPLQLAALARYRIFVHEGVSDAQAFALVGAFASGRFIYPFLPGNDTSYVDERAYWVQGALEYELQKGNGFRFTAGAGFAALVATSDVKNEYSDAGPIAGTPRWFPSFYVSFGAGI